MDVRCDSSVKVQLGRMLRASPAPGGVQPPARRLSQCVPAAAGEFCAVKPFGFLGAAFPARKKTVEKVKMCYEQHLVAWEASAVTHNSSL